MTDTYMDTKGDPNTIMSMFCPVQELTRSSNTGKETFVTGFRISISNDGHNFGETEEMFIFNSTFQEFEVIDGEIKFALKVFKV